MNINHRSKSTMKAGGELNILVLILIAVAGVVEHSFGDEGGAEIQDQDPSSSMSAS